MDSSNSPDSVGQPNAVGSENLQAARWARIPALLRDRAQWALAGADKAPLAVRGGSASSTDPTTWATFDEVCAAAIARGLDIGFMLHPDDGLSCIDLDVKDGAPQAQLDKYQRIVNAFQSYSEFSRSGRGMHIWVKGKIGPGVKRNGIEVYSQERFIICPGTPYLDLPVEDRQEMLSDMVADLRGAEAAAEPVSDQPETYTDEMLWKRAREADDGEKFIMLCQGSWEGKPEYPSQSEADFALMGMFAFYSKNDEQCIRMFCRTVLAKREKATEKNCRYLRRTLANLRRKEAAKQPHGVTIDLQILNLEAANSATDMNFRLAQPGVTILETRYLIDPWLPRATVIGLYGRGEAGKSSWAAQLCAGASNQVSTLWISSEERQDHIMQRHLSCGGETKTLAMIDVLPTVIDPKTKKPAATSFNIYDHMERAIVAFKQNAGMRTDRPLGIVVLDAVVALTTWAKGENANDDAAVKRLLATLFMLAERHDVTFIVLGHLNKGTGHDHIADAVTGAAAWTNSVRLAFMFVKDLESDDFEGFVRTVKSNTGTHFGIGYKTAPVFTLRQRPDGRNDVLCGVQLTGDIVYGEMALREMMAGDDDKFLTKIQHKRDRVELLCQRVLGQLAIGPTSRKQIEGLLGGEKITPRHWQAADAVLTRDHRVKVEKTGHGTFVYTHTAPT